MKKLVLSLIVVLFSATAFAQLNGGLKAGLNLANWGGDIKDDFDSKTRVGFHAGAYLTFNLSDAISIQPELLYNSVGAKLDDADFGEVDFVMDYITIPVMLLYNVNETFNVQVGPQFGFLTKAEAKADGDSEDIKDDFTATDLGLNFGVGLNFGKFNAAARYSLGLSNVLEDSDDFTGKNNVIQISVGYKLFGN